MKLYVWELGDEWETKVIFALAENDQQAAAMVKAQLPRETLDGLVIVNGNSRTGPYITTDHYVQCVSHSG